MHQCKYWNCALLARWMSIAKRDQVCPLIYTREYSSALPYERSEAGQGTLTSDYNVSTDGHLCDFCVIRISRDWFEATCCFPSFPIVMPQNRMNFSADRRTTTHTYVIFSKLCWFWLPSILCMLGSHHEYYENKPASPTGSLYRSSTSQSYLGLHLPHFVVVCKKQS